MRVWVAAFCLSSILGWAQAPAGSARATAGVGAPVPELPPASSLTAKQRAAREQQWRKEIRHQLYVPEKLPPLEAKVWSSFTPVAGVIADRVTYQTAGGMVVPAIVYRPEHSKGKLPGIVVVNGHGGDKYSWYAFWSGMAFGNVDAGYGGELHQPDDTPPARRHGEIAIHREALGRPRTGIGPVDGAPLRLQHGLEPLVARHFDHLVGPGTDLGQVLAPPPKRGRGTAPCRRARRIPDARDRGTRSPAGRGQPSSSVLARGEDTTELALVQRNGALVFLDDHALHCRAPDPEFRSPWSPHFTSLGHASSSPFTLTAPQGQGSPARTMRNRSNSKIQSRGGRPTRVAGAGERDGDGASEAAAQNARAGPEPCSSFSRSLAAPEGRFRLWRAQAFALPHRGQPRRTDPETRSQKPVSRLAAIKGRVMKGFEPSTLRLTI